ncbi:hypothetical protein [Profundibacter sp.]
MNEIDETDKAFLPLAQAAAARWRALFDQMTAQEGLPVAAVLAGAHAEIATAMAVFYGGDVAAERMASIAQIVADIPAMPVGKLAICEPAGSA